MKLKQILYEKHLGNSFKSEDRIVREAMDGTELWLSDLPDPKDYPDAQSWYEEFYPKFHKKLEELK